MEKKLWSSIRCFGCGDKFARKEDVYRDKEDKYKPYCKECMAEIAYSRVHRYEVDCKMRGEI